MERRLITFFLASAVFVTAFMAMNAMFPPPPPPLQEGQAENDAAAVPAEQDPDQALDERMLPSSPGEVTSGRDEGNVSAVDEDPDFPPKAADTWTTLGSMDPTSGYHLLVTLRSRGGAIERIEMTERKDNGRLKYRRVDVRSGYLGYLALSPSAIGDGPIVNVVGPGTPASLATGLSGQPDGLRVGDRIVAVDGQAVGTAADLAQLLETTKPFDEITIDVIRQAPVAATNEPAEGEQPAPPSTIQFQVTLSEHPLDLVRAADTAGADQVQGNLSRPSSLLTLSHVGSTSIRTGQLELPQLVSQHNTSWEISQQDADGFIEFELPLPENIISQAGGSGAVELARSYRLEPASYHIDLNFEIRNRGETPQKLGYRLEGPNGLTLEGWWYSTKISPNFSGAAARDFVYNTSAEGRELISAYTLLDTAQSTPRDPDQVIFVPESSDAERELRYIGVDAQYFSVSYVPTEGETKLADYARAAGMVVAQPSLIPSNQERAANISFYLDSVPQTVPAGGALSHGLRMFAGPKEPQLLADYGLVETLEYGWFGWVASPLSTLLHIFYAIVGNYAVAIIMLTLLVRGCMFPLSRKAAIHAQKMQELAPELKKIAEKYKDDFEKRLKAQRELQQRVGFNPLSGCLPMFVQLPIFMGLYRALSVDIELRQAALSSKLQWASNLAGPDMLFYWGDLGWDYLFGRGTGWLGPYFNILPIIVVGLFLVQQKMFMPPATDEQTAMTQKVMTVMTLMMGLFFFRVPSGLCVYFITSSLWGIVERKAVKKMVPKTPQLNLAGVSEGGNSPTQQTAGKQDSGKQSIGDRIRSAAGMPNESDRVVLPPSKRKRPPGKKK
ncbi:YidC/Oxa1 family insertase periplasmic-domain containing protein [Planctomycetaceae bacterium SH139]